MNDHICSVFDRTEDDRCKGVIYDNYSVVFVCDFCNSIQIGHITVGIAKGLYKDSLGVGTDSCFKSLEVVRIEDGIIYSLSAESMGNEIVRTAIDVVGSNNVVTILCNVLECISDRSRTRSNCKPCHSSFEGCDAVFKYSLSGVGQTAIDVACVAKTKAVCCMLRVAEHIRCGLIDRHSTCVSCWIWSLLSHMEGKCFNVKFLCHSCVFFI